jgi:subtilisin-like proprotein convertase family protein
MLCVCTDCEIGPACSDNVDNDGDAQIDCADADCAGNLRCIPETACADGLDNDLDEQIDCHDSQCNGLNNCQFGTETSCADAFDNDADGRSDCFDTDCTGTATCGAAEIDCTNGIDDDGDGAKDCADLGCKPNAACQVVETTCQDGFDNDGDGVADCDDSNCVNEIACAVPACPAGTQELVIAATDLPLAIPDSNPTGATSMIQITQPGTVQRVVVLYSAVHTWSGDMDISLMSPGTGAPGIDLSSGNGSSGDNYTDTIFSDNAPNLITGGTAPFTGPYKPEGMLSTLAGQPLAGAWKLLVADHAGSDVGSITRFQLDICYTPPPGGP